MTKSLILAIGLIFFFTGSFADPIFLLSSRKIDDISRNIFLDDQSFIDLIDNKFLQSDTIPNNIFVFNVKLDDKKYVENPDLILKKLSYYPSLKNHFGPSPNTFSSAYVKDALTDDFKDKILNAIQKNSFQTMHLTIKGFSFESIKNLRKTNNQNILTIVDVPMNQLVLLDALFHQFSNKFGYLSNNNYLIVMKFTDHSSEFIPNPFVNLELKGRMLDEEEAAADQPAVTTSTTDAPPIGILGPAFAGYVIALMAMLAAYFGFNFLNDVKTPARFVKTTLVIGKEH